MSETPNAPANELGKLLQFRTRAKEIISPSQGDIDDVRGAARIISLLAKSFVIPHQESRRMGKLLQFQTRTPEIIPNS